MVNQAGRALEIIGVRAVILDARNYVAQGKQIEAATAGMARGMVTAGNVTAASAVKQQAALAQIDAAYQKLAASRTALTTAVNAQQAGIAAGASLAQQAKLTKGVELAQKDLVRSVEGVGAAFSAQAAVAAQTAAAEVAANARVAASHQRIIQLQAARLSSAIKLGGVAAVGVAAVGLISVTKAAASYETILKKIDVLTEASTQQTQELGNALLEMSHTIPSTPDELGAAAYFALSSGIKDTADALKIAEIAGKDAAIGIGTTTDAAILLTGVVNAYGKENITAAQANDLLLGAIQEGKAEANDFANSLGRVLPFASQLNVGFDELVSVIAALTNQSLSAEESTTALRQILQELNNPSEEAKKALAEVGKSADSLRAEIRDKGLIQAMIDLFAAFEGNPAEITKVIDNVRALTGFLAAFGEQSQRTVDIHNRVLQQNGLTDRSFKEMSETFNFQAQLLKTQLNVALIRLGQEVLPTLTKALTSTNEFLSENKETISDVIGLLPQLAEAFVFAFAPLINIIKTVKELNDALDDLTGKSIGNVLNPGGVAGDVLKSLPLVGPIFQAADTLGIGEAKKKVEELDKASEDTAITLGKLKRNVGETGEESEEFAKKLKELAQDFQSTSEAARQVDRLTDSLNLFGRITQELANAAGLSATQSGNVQGFDAVAAAEARAAQEAFNLTQALATVAGAFQYSASVANEIVYGMAQSALAASKAAAQAIFQITREVANLNVALAQARLAQAQAAAAANQALYSLQQQLANINAQIANQSQQALQPVSRPTGGGGGGGSTGSIGGGQVGSFSVRDDGAIGVAKSQLDQLRLANDIAKAAAVQADINFERLINANVKRQSVLQEAFLKSNEELQKQINEAIGRGDTETALALTDEQQEAARAYQDQAKSLEDNRQSLEEQRRAADLAERERANAAELAIRREEYRTQALEKSISAQEKHTTATVNQTTAADANTQSLTVNTQAQQTGTTALEKQRDAIQAQIERIEQENAARQHAVTTIQDQINIFQAQSDLLKAQVDAADQTRLTQEEQAAKARELIAQIEIESQAVRDLSGLLNKDLIPEMDEARKQFFALQEASRVLADDGFRSTLIDRGIDPAAESLRLMKLATDEVTGAQKKQAEQITTSVNEIRSVFDDFVQEQEERNNVKPGTIKPPNTGDAGLVDPFEAISRAINAINSEFLPAVEDFSSTLRIVSESSLVTSQSLQQASASIQQAGVDISVAGTNAANAIANSTGSISNAITAGTLNITNASLAGSEALIAAAVFQAELLIAQGQAIAAGMEETSSNVMGSGENLAQAINNTSENIFAAASAILGAINSFGATVVANINAATNAAVNAINNAIKSSGGGTTGGGSTGSGGGGTGTIKAAVGGFFDRPTRVLLGEEYKTELVLPLGRPDKSRELLERIPRHLLERILPGFTRGGEFSPQLLGSISPNVMASLTARNASSNIFAPNISVSGETLETMEATAIRAVQAAFRDARNVSRRSGGLIRQGIGPGS